MLQAIATLVSIGIVGLMVAELWKNRLKLGFVWKTYFGCGLLTYARALGTLVATLGTFAIATRFAPPFMFWGWGTLLFGQSGNIIFQPLNLIQANPPPERPALPTPPPETITASPMPLDGPVVEVSPIPSDPSTIRLPPGFLESIGNFDYWLLLMVCFWLLLILLIPFWANLEEQIFRRGANTWKQIAIRSTLFGFAHLTAGIPLLGGLVLIIPGFLFACRYKYIRDRSFRRTKNSVWAQEAGVNASTADHAVYNAILITAVVAISFLPRMMLLFR